MMKMKKDSIKYNQNGEVMLEASMIYVIILFLLMALLGLSFMFYEKAMLTSVADELAAEIAKNYKYSTNELGDNNIDADEIEEVKMYRNTFCKGTVKNNLVEGAEDYLNQRIPLGSLGFGPQTATVECEIYGGGIGRNYVKVTVSQDTEFFLSGILEFMDITNDKEVGFSATAYAECVDLLGYTASINFARYTTDFFGPLDPIGDLYQNVKGFAEALFSD